MEMTPTKIPDVLLVKPRRFGDQRGWFMESWQAERYQQLGLPERFVQDNQAYSQQGVLRGLHIQNPFGQGKLVQVIRGEVFDVAVDVRQGSPWFGQWIGAHLSEDNHHQLYVPVGFAHGYLVLSEDAIFSYKCTDYYHPETQFSIRWDDPQIGIEWPGGLDPILAEKDRDAPLLSEIAVEQLPVYQPTGESIP
ncbi:MAG: dTDP-4-dehydrorhamnose 3,5-epimerase [gamma proteobacterium symbiont of Ctena orbiculata]|uniref:dTDP-4-dehydrorhamnose 3,5-epimerase n=1 Tax=Candidatus Thiodiazotropha taylori TaxID=2792791 RepID=A0A944MC28_9GAMM|nr:dTDP-4-dehydrorhamnose 3,5-epimerase [Candidatus Thiodiazotropha taylori]PUB87399.1 MAG: dTDP-4-dehydrorhamnose 3,5-epimerase [gamma proteobacterium symbiont of Ctena orbiculata]MBT2990652.1 dTDP-4-dehydrorhamnose 3,5-epimerase [Candidatus Thiodiazotropha taylori]MBT2996864.1 dTDP-4-dehydrorhamnose 3,5-epimerase [Candidatus Thiodiazotropha taylori]MBT3002097.1 dTDP-4-dehydrorhamnose 3,5-epimerase [Candidatus Thiodiazotropha taylori]